MRFAAEVIGCLVIAGIFTFGLYRISVAMDKYAEARALKRKTQIHPKPKKATPPNES